MLYAARGGRTLRAIAPFCGALPGDESLIPELCPTVASYGGLDQVFGALGPTLETALDGAAIPNDVRTYPDAGHSFMNQHHGLLARLGAQSRMHVAFDEAASADAWTRVLAFFGEHLAGGAAPDRGAA
jgi:carboxymethylenebutenolidase